MSQYDRFVYYESYVRIQKYINLGNWEKYFSSKEAFHNKITSPVVELMNGTEKGDSTVVSDAYLKLMDWQYDYVRNIKRHWILSREKIILRVVVQKLI